MKEGMYGITFQSSNDFGMGSLIFEGGRIFGADVGGVKYDGTYQLNPASGKVDVAIKITFPPNVPAVFGMSNPYEWAFNVSAELDPSVDQGATQVRTSLGHTIAAQYVYLRAIPEAA